MADRPIPRDCGLRLCIGGVNVQDYDDLIIGTMAEKALKGYQAALTPMVIQVLRAVPPNDRIEFVFEQQREYEDAVAATIWFAAKTDLDYKRTNEGLPKLANWYFVPKGLDHQNRPC
jgi:hypothetical protein